MRILYGHFIVLILFPMSLLIHVGKVGSGYILIEISHIYVRKGCHVDIIVNLLDKRGRRVVFLKYLGQLNLQPSQIHDFIFSFCLHAWR